MLKYRLVTGISVAAFFLAIFAFGPYWALLLLLLAVYATAHHEMRLMICSGGLSVAGLATFLAGLAYLCASLVETGLIQARWPALAQISIPPSETVLWLVPPILLALEVVRGRPEGAAQRFGLSLVTFWYVTIQLSFMMRIGFLAQGAAGEVADHSGRLALTYFVWVVKWCDVGAYSIGMIFGRGRRKLIPAISPAKSVAGLGGAYLGGLLSSLAACWALQRFWGGSGLAISYSHAVVIGVLLATTGVLGDLGESLFKRSLGIKDSGKQFPGMGGFLDVIDSLLFSAPFMYLYLRWFVL